MTESVTQTPETQAPAAPVSTLADKVKDFAGVKTQPTLFAQAVNQTLSLALDIEHGSLANAKTALGSAYLAYLAYTAACPQNGNSLNGVQQMSVFGMYQQQTVTTLNRAVTTIISALCAANGVAGADIASATDAFKFIAEKLGTTLEAEVAAL